MTRTRGVSELAMGRAIMGGILFLPRASDRPGKPAHRRRFDRETRSLVVDRQCQTRHAPNFPWLEVCDDDYRGETGQHSLAGEIAGPSRSAGWITTDCGRR